LKDGMGTHAAFFKPGAFEELSRRTSPAFLNEGKEMSLDPGESRLLEPVAADGTMRVGRIHPRAGEAGASIVRGNGVESPNES